MKKKNTTLLLGRNIVWAIVIFVLCAMPGESVPNPHLNIPHLDKIVHFGMFFVMALLICNELEYQTRLKQRTIFIIAISITCLYGGIIEILQHKYFNRSGDVMDLLADVAGGIIACFLYSSLRKLKHRIFNSKRK